MLGCFRSAVSPWMADGSKHVSLPRRRRSSEESPLVFASGNSGTRASTLRTLNPPVAHSPGSLKSMARHGLQLFSAVNHFVAPAPCRSFGTYVQLWRALHNYA